VPVGVREQRFNVPRRAAAGEELQAHALEFGGAPCEPPAEGPQQFRRDLTDLRDGIADVPFAGGQPARAGPIAITLCAGGTAIIVVSPDRLPHGRFQRLFDHALNPQFDEGRFRITVGALFHHLPNRFLCPL
jgi:hypothetical protein